ncbi:T9SS type A sorting domain-containing protein [uncultured Kordia sp.]|uniref:T9SS type A sorting domain-containing protein n=1 Tax=uncultured Kordia sp. TaxID=507699 RepID=UPI00261222FA|nr:T9SS type A sorting domain-containing protein [uncultured Kordia sp.]
MKRTLLLLLMLAPLLSMGQWTIENAQITTTLSQFGTSIAMSDDGLTIAVAAPFANSGAGIVRVYQNNNGSWSQLGSDIVGETNQDFLGSEEGLTLSLSGDGTTLALGSQLGDNGPQQNVGKVRVLRYSTGNWSQIGTTIYGNKAFDNLSNVDLNFDGNTMIIAAPSANSADDNLFAIGYVKVFEYNATDWQQIGSDFIGTDEDGYLGTGISINDDGTIIAFAGDTPVQVYERNANTWNLKGSPISIPFNINSNKLLDLNGSGDIISISNNRASNSNTSIGRVRTLEYSSATGNWQHLDAIAPETMQDWSEDGLGTAMALSKNANYIAVSIPKNTDNNNAGRIEIYNYNGTQWVEVFGVTGPTSNQEIGNEPRSLSISANGRCFGIGNPDNQEVTVYCNSAILGVNPVADNDKVYITPNPSKNAATIYLQDIYSNVQVSIYNLLGQKVQQAEFFYNNKLYINTSKLNTGTYVVKLNMLGKIKTLRLLIE